MAELFKKNDAGVIYWYNSLDGHIHIEVLSINKTWRVQLGVRNAANIKDNRKHTTLKAAQRRALRFALQEKTAHFDIAEVLRFMDFLDGV